MLNLKVLVSQFALHSKGILFDIFRFLSLGQNYQMAPVIV